jgi:GNAT superfamily N-acetyltransferase
MIEELAANATAVPTTQLLGGWILRAAPDLPFRRCNSVLPLAGGPDGHGDRIAVAEEFYRDRGLCTRFQISPAAHPSGLDDDLDQRGYEIEEPTLVLLADTERVYERTEREATHDVSVRDGIEEPWVADYALAHGDDERARERLRSYGHLMRRLGPSVATAVLPVEGVPAAIGLGVLERGWVGVFAMGTRPEARRRGAATAVLHALTCWARRQGADRLYLQVESANDAARQLYVRAGFETAYRYHYRTAGLDQPVTA